MYHQIYSSVGDLTLHNAYAIINGTRYNNRWMNNRTINPMVCIICRFKSPHCAFNVKFGTGNHFKTQ